MMMMKSRGGEEENNRGHCVSAPVSITQEVASHQQHVLLIEHGGGELLTRGSF
jgi:hypothetical protein